MSDHKNNIRVFLQTQAGLNEISGRANARVELPGEHVSNSIVFGNHTVSRASTLVVKRYSHQTPTYFDPSHSGHPLIASTQPQHVAQDNVPEIDQATVEEDNLQGFNIRESVATLNPFADIGIVVEDESAVAEDEEAEQTEQTEQSNSEYNASNVVDPQQLYEELSTKGVKNFGISKEELASFHLTVGQLKKLYTDVTGKTPMNVPSGKMKRRIRDVAAQSYADFTRVMSSIKTVIGNS